MNPPTFLDTIEGVTSEFRSIERLRAELAPILNDADIDEVINGLKMNIAYRRMARTLSEPGEMSSELSPCSASADDTIPCPDFVASPKAPPKQMDIPPDRWGVRMSQFNELVDYVKEQPMYKQIRDKQGCVNFYDLSQHAIVPWTRDSPCSIALMLNPKGEQAQLVITHAWGDDIEEFAEALTCCVADHGLAMEDPVIWLGCLALYQARAGSPAALGPTIEEQLALNPFKSVIETQPLAVLAVHTTSGNLYNRLQCCKELQETQIYYVDIWVAASQRYSDSLVEGFAHFRKRAPNPDVALKLWTLAKSVAVDTYSAKCLSRVDEQLIRLHISKCGGFKVLDELILSAQRAGFLELLRRRAGSRRDAGCTPADLCAEGYSAVDLIREGYSAGELQSVALSAADMKRGGAQAHALRRAGFSAQSLKQAGFSLHELLKSGFSAQDLESAGFSIRQLEQDAGFSVKKLLRAGFSVEQLRNAGFGGRELAQKLKDAGFSARQLKDDGFTSLQLKGAGYAMQELQVAGFAAQELSSQEFPGDSSFAVQQLRQATSSRQARKSATLS